MIPSWARTAALLAMFANPPDVPGVIHAVAFASDGDFWDVSPSQAAAYQRQRIAQPPAAPGP